MQKFHSESALNRPTIADGQRETLHIRSETLELIAGKRLAIAQPRLLMAEAGVLVCSSKVPLLQSAKIPE
jgi:hypothetical protein